MGSTMQDWPAHSKEGKSGADIFSAKGGERTRPEILYMAAGALVIKPPGQSSVSPLLLATWQIKGICYRPRRCSIGLLSQWSPSQWQAKTGWAPPPLGQIEMAIGYQPSLWSTVIFFWPGHCCYRAPLTSLKVMVVHRYKMGLDPDLWKLHRKLSGRGRMEGEERKTWASTI